MSQLNISKIIRNRRAVFPNMYSDKVIPDEIIREILENANWAPTHRHTEPWRFKVMQSEALARLSEFMGNYYKENTPSAKFSPMKLKKTLKKPLQSSCVIAICMQRDPSESLPEWEEIAAVACAVQNMWLTCAAYGIGCYWSSPASIKTVNRLFPLEPGEKCLGFLYMGYYEGELVPGKRNPVEDKVTWMKK